MKKLLLMGLIWMGCAAQAAPAPAAPQAGKDYKVLENPQPVNAPAEKIEILEFFMYGCPHCEHFEPVLTGWVKKQSPDIVLKHVPLAFNKALAAHQKLYHALDALGLADQLTPSIFKAIHTERNYLLTPEAQAAFLAKKASTRKSFWPLIIHLKRRTRYSAITNGWRTTKSRPRRLCLCRANMKLRPP